MKTKEEIINSIPVDKANFEHIAATGKINGSLLTSIEQAMEQYRQETIEQVREELLKQTFLMVHENNYPSEAVPKATILSLPSLMKIAAKRNITNTL